MRVQTSRVYFWWLRMRDTWSHHPGSISLTRSHVIASRHSNSLTQPRKAPRCSSRKLASECTRCLIQAFARGSGFGNLHEHNQGAWIPVPTGNTKAPVPPSHCRQDPPNAICPPDNNQPQRMERQSFQLHSFCVPAFWFWLQP